MPKVRLKHRCAADGCAVMVPHRMLMCLADWRRVPLDIQREVNRRYRPIDAEGRAAPSPAYVVAVGLAIKAVREQRAREQQRVHEARTCD